MVISRDCTREDNIDSASSALRDAHLRMMGESATSFPRDTVTHYRHYISFMLSNAD